MDAESWIRRGLAPAEEAPWVQWLRRVQAEGMTAMDASNVLRVVVAGVRGPGLKGVGAKLLDCGHFHTAVPVMDWSRAYMWGHRPKSEEVFENGAGI